MSDKVIENNQVSVIGEIVSGFTFSHEVFGEGFYMVDVLVRGLSDSADVIPVIHKRNILIFKDKSRRCVFCDMLLLLNV